MTIPRFFDPKPNRPTNVHPLYFWGYAFALALVLFTLTR